MNLCEQISYDAVVAGHICMDVIPAIACRDPDAFRTVFAPSRTVQAGEVTIAVGGAVPNVGLVMNRLGMRTFMTGKVGDDLFGRGIVEAIMELDPGAALDLHVDPEVHTSYSIVLDPPGLDRCLLHYPGANDAYRAADLDPACLDQARLLHLGYPPAMRALFENNGAELAALLRKAKACGVATSLDMTMSDPDSLAGRADWRAILEHVLPHVDLFLPSLEETLYMLHRDLLAHLREQTADGSETVDYVTPEILHELSDACLAMGAGIVGLKLGRRGCYLRAAVQDGTRLGRACPSEPEAWRNAEIWSPCFQVEVGDVPVGDYGTWGGKLIKRLDKLEYAAAYGEFRELEERIRTMMTEGMTLSDYVNDLYREAAAKVLERPEDFL